MTAAKSVLNLHPDDREWFNEAFHEASLEFAPFCARVRLRRQGRTYRWMLFHGIPTFLDGGDFAGYVGCLLAGPTRSTVTGAILPRKDRSR